MDVEKMRRHLGVSYELKLGEDVFRIPPLQLKDIPEFWSVMTTLGSGSEKDAIAKLDKAMTERMIGLIRTSLERSPDVDSVDKQMLDEFIATNYMELMTALLEANMPQVAMTDRSKLERLKRKHESAVVGQGDTRQEQAKQA